MKSLPAPRTSGELPGPFSHFLLGAAGGGKSQSAPSLLSPGKGVMHSRRTNSLNSTRQTYIHGHTQTQKLMTVLFQSASHSQVSGDQRHSAAGPPTPSAVRSRPGSTPSLPSALSAWGVGASRQPGGTQPSRWGRPRIQPPFRTGAQGLRRPRWQCSKGSCLSAPAYRSRSAQALRLPPRSPLPRLPPGRPRGFSVRVPRSWNRRC